jgi:hypothetical protein
MPIRISFLPYLFGTRHAVSKTAETTCLALSLPLLIDHEGRIINEPEADERGD